MINSKKRSERSPSDEIVSPEHKTPRAESIMASPLSEKQQQETTSSESEPNLKDIYSLLVSIQDTVATLLTENNKLSTDMAELKSSVAKNNFEVTKMKEEMKQQCKYVASLEKQITHLTKVTKKQKEELEVLQVGLDDLEQYSRKNSLELYGIPEEIDMSTDEIVCKVAVAIGVNIQCDDIEISHRLKRRHGIKPIIAKFSSHKDKTKVYKARLQLRGRSVMDIFPDYSSTTDTPKRIYINENLTHYRKEMLDLALKKKKDEKILSAWSLDGKIFVKTSPTGRPRKMSSIEEIEDL